MGQRRTTGSNSLINQAMSAELLDAETERDLAIRWREHGDHAAMHRLVRAYMRLAVSMASKYRRYGASMGDLIQEAYIGLLKAAEKFDPAREVRFSTYAMWWIKAQVQDFVMRDWSMVRTGSTSAQKSLFFNLSRVRAQIERTHTAEGSEVDRARLRDEIADELGVPLRDVEAMEGRLSGSDFSLNARQADDDGREWIELLEDDNGRTDEAAERQADLDVARGWLSDAMDTLTDRERQIISARKLTEKPETLESLGRAFSLSKERIRQLEEQALRKMRMRLEESHGAAPAELLGAV